MTELEKLFDRVKKHSRRSMHKKGSVHPTFVFEVPGKAGCGVIPCPWDSELQKHWMVTQMKAQFAELKVERFGFYVESWITDLEGLGPYERTPSERLARRQEVVLVYVEDRDGSSKTGWWPISHVGGQVTLGHFITKELGLPSAASTFANMFAVDIFH